jgi:hypothetical protein
VVGAPWLLLAEGWLLMSGSSSCGSWLTMDASKLLTSMPPSLRRGFVWRVSVCCSRGGGHWFVVECQYTVCCSTSSWTIWGGGHRCVVGCQYTVCCSTSSWTIWGGGHRCVVGCQYTVCCGTSSWTIWGGGHRCVVGCQYTVCCCTSCWTTWGAFGFRWRCEFKLETALVSRSAAVSSPPLQVNSITKL